MPPPVESADDFAGFSSAVQVCGEVPSACVRKPKRPVFWFDQSTPIFWLGRAVTTAMSSALIPVARVTGAENVVYGASEYLTCASVSASEATHIRPVESTSRVAVSLPGRDKAVAVGRADQRAYVWFCGSSWIETSELEGPWSSTWTTSPTSLVSARTSVLVETRRTLVQAPEPGSCRQTQVPAGEVLVEAMTAHQVPSAAQSFDWGFSPVFPAIGMLAEVIAPSMPAEASGTSPGAAVDAAGGCQASSTSPAAVGGAPTSTK